MRRKIALVLAGAMLALSVPAVASSNPFMTPPGAARKACLESGGTWTPYLQICTY